MNITLVHGLNVNPEMMRQLARHLDIDTYKLNIIALSGHNSHDAKLRRKNLNTLVDETWVNDFSQQYTHSATNVVIAYSLGAVVALEYFLRHPEHIPHKFILFAPALSFKRWTHGWKVFAPLKSVGIPSFQPSHYRSNKSTPINAYKQLFALNKKLVDKDWRPLNIPTLVFANFGDELISPAGISTQIEEHKLDKWQFDQIDRKEAQRNKRHMIIAKEYMTEQSWQYIYHEIHQFLS